MSPASTSLDAPIVAVTVHPSLARVTRTGAATVEAGTTDVVLAGLPATIDESSVRVAGRAATPVRVVGVDITHRRLTDAPDERVAGAEAALRQAEEALGAVHAEDTGEAAREQLLLNVAERGGKSFAVALASGDADPARLASAAAALSGQLRAIADRRRALAVQRVQAERGVAAVAAELERLRSSGRDRRDVVVSVEADAAGPVELEVTYVAAGAGWRPTYDVRVDGDGGPLTLTWGAVLTQATGENWPACALTVSTAQPQLATTVPELDPWWIGAYEPVARAKSRGMAVGGAMPPPPGAPMMAMQAADTASYVEAEELVAEVVETTLAASWRLPRPTAVPADGAPHRAVLATAELESQLDHVTAPAVATEVHLRATVTNTTGRALLPGAASVYLDDAFVGTATIEGVAPGDELELALGVDDRVVAERELVRRDADKRRLGSTRGAHETWKIEVTNHRVGPISLVVRDRVPTSRHADVKVVDVKLRPEPHELDDLGRIEWKAEVAPTATWTAEVAFGVEHPKDLPVSGWR